MGRLPGATPYRWSSVTHRYQSGSGAPMRNRSRTLDGRVLLPLLFCATAACGGEGAFDAWCNTPGTEMWLLIYALAPGTIAAAVVGSAHKRRLDRWDLRESASAPSSGTTVWILLGGFIVAGLVLSLAVNGADGCAPEQRTTNLRFTWLGILLSAVLCLLARFGASWWYTRR